MEAKRLQQLKVDELTCLTDPGPGDLGQAAGLTSHLESVISPKNSTGSSESSNLSSDSLTGSSDSQSLCGLFRASDDNTRSITNISSAVEGLNLSPEVTSTVQQLVTSMNEVLPFGNVKMSPEEIQSKMDNYYVSNHGNSTVKSVYKGH